MGWFKNKNKVEFPRNWKIGAHSGIVYQDWKDVPFDVFMKWLQAEDVEDKICLLTGCKKEHLKDVLFRQKMEQLTLYSKQMPVADNSDMTMILDSVFYHFSQDIDLLKYTYDQFSYIDMCLRPYYKLMKDLDDENAKEEPDANKIAHISEKQMIQMLLNYPRIISAYANVAHNSKHDSDVVMSNYKLINQLSTTKILTLGGFFLKSFIAEKFGKTKSKPLRFQRVKDFLKITNALVMNGIMSCGVRLSVFHEWLKNTGNYLAKSNKKEQVT